MMRQNTITVKVKRKVVHRVVTKMPSFRKLRWSGSIIPSWRKKLAKLANEKSGVMPPLFGVQKLNTTMPMSGMTRKTISQIDAGATSQPG